ncbi:Zinc finger MYM-type protein 1 [Eumeta japonica]|uniref:Zinc finger MYM-type protein 1 n=1 Tax=Eumeta variegata TaxID=151549 RepID=A0A4C1TYS0_EUMVA|nr:Zinc finger MYM-type protein 1 [Eumeta japonica]
MKDPNLNEVLTHIPQNATYRSPEIQNQIIQAMVQAVRSSIVKDINESDVKWFTLMEDGTRDKNNRENIALAIRYVKDGVVNESLLMVKTTENLDAATFTELTLNTLTENNIDPSCMLSQCYDGVSVSGKVSGVATRIENKLGRKIPYVHCYNHRLHLIVIRTISEMTFIRLFFDQCIMLHEFFHHGKIAALYDGKRIGRLLEQRWSGHLAVTKVVYDNYSSILQTLKEIKNGRFNGDDVAKSIGLKIPSREEASVVKAYLSRNEDIMENTLQVLYRQREAFKDTYELLRLWRP